MTDTITYRYYRRTFLNRPRHEGGAYVIAAIETARPGRRRAAAVDCSRRLVLTFRLDTASVRRNSLAKARLLARIFQEFADALEAEAALVAKRRPRIRQAG